jgi:hypothetical protein
MHHPSLHGLRLVNPGCCLYSNRAVSATELALGRSDNLFPTPVGVNRASENP